MTGTTERNQEGDDDPNRAGSIEIFLAVQTVQLLAGGLSLFAIALILEGGIADAAVAFGSVTLGYYGIAIATGYPLAALAIALIHRQPWAAMLHLGVTLIAGFAFVTGWFTEARFISSFLAVPLLIGPLAGFFVFRAMSRSSLPLEPLTPPPPTP